MLYTFMSLIEKQKLRESMFHNHSPLFFVGKPKDVHSKGAPSERVGFVCD